MTKFQNRSEKMSQSATLVDILRYRAIHTPDETAFIFVSDNNASEHILNYGELDRAARALAGQILMDCRQGERALLLYPHGLDFISAFFGCLYSGVVAVPAYPPRANRKSQRIKLLAKDVQASTILTTASHLGSIEKMLPELAMSGAVRMMATDLLTSGDAPTVALISPDADALAFIQYTSGSTGTPKGVMVTHGNIVHNQNIIEKGFGSTRASVAVGWLPMFHDMGLVGIMLHPIYLGFPAIICSPSAFIKKPVMWLQMISHYRASLSGAPNFAYDLCVDMISEEQKSDLDLSHWGVAFNGAEPIRAQTLDKFANAFKSCGFRKEAFYPCYGMAETTLMISGGHHQSFPDESIEKSNKTQNGESESANIQRVVSCGFPLLDQKLLVAHPKTMNPCDEGDIGEIWTSGPSVAQGYWNQPEETEQVFRAYLSSNGDGPYLRTGDLGFMKEGQLYVTGRIKDLIIIRGRNHYPQDIEATVEQSHPSLNIAGGAAFSVEVDGQERLVVVQEVNRRALRRVNVKEVCTCIRQALLQYHEVSVYAILLTRPLGIPKTSSGKIQRQACKKAYLSGEFKIVGQWSETVDKQKRPVDVSHSSVKVVKKDIEQWLAVKIADRTGMAPNRIDPHQALTSHGLDSMAMMSLMGELEAWLQCELSLTLVYDYPTLASLAGYLAGEAGFAGETGVNPSPDLQETPSPDLQETIDGAIAVVGMGCRLPGAKTVDEFWQVLSTGTDAITPVPSSRWDCNLYPVATRQGGFIENIELFDPMFFGISPREAKFMDPQQRLLLEVTHEALENACITPGRLAGTQTGVFVGISSHDYSDSQSGERVLHMGTGNAQSIAANRVSYTYDLRGPSFSIDTACSSSLVAVHQACLSLRSGESDVAIAGGVNVMLSPEVSCIFSESGMLAADGRCKTFDISADGYVRGEGCGVVILKRLTDAVADGTPILALIRGSAINQDGRSNGLTAPNGPSQRAVIAKALDDAKKFADQVGFVEAHGTGTFLGDPIEFNSLAEIMSDRSEEAGPCGVGSVKTNIGHLEAAAGIAGLIKTVLMLKHGHIPPHLHITELNPHLLTKSFPLTIPRKLEIWKKGKQPRVAGVSSFGFGGTNAHVVIQEAPLLNKGVVPAEQFNNLLLISAKHQLALKELAQRYEDLLIEYTAEIPEICARAATGRDHYEERLAIVGNTTEEIVQGISSYLKGNLDHSYAVGRVPENPLQLVFLFSGNGSQYARMGAMLYEEEPYFRETIEGCAACIEPLLPQSLMKMLHLMSDEAVIDAEDKWVQIIDFTIEYSLAQLWRKWEVTPGAVMGCGIGEYVAACIAGIITLEEAFKLVIGNERLKRGDVREVIGGLTFCPSSIPFVSSLTGRVVDDAGFPKYLVERFQASDRYRQGYEELECKGFNVFFEIGPGRSMSPSLESCASSNTRVISSLHNGKQDREGLLYTLRDLYIFGVKVDFISIFGDRVSSAIPDLPSYPFQRRRYWCDKKEKELVPGSKPGENNKQHHPLLGQRLCSPVMTPRQVRYETDFDRSLPVFFNDHRVVDDVIFPASGFLEMLMMAATDFFKANRVSLDNILFLSPLIAPCEVERTLQTIVVEDTDGNATAKIYSIMKEVQEQEEHWILHVSAFISPLSTEDDHEEINSIDGILVENFYQRSRHQGLDYQKLFQGIESLWRHGDLVQGDVLLNNALKPEVKDYLAHPALFDSAMQIVREIIPEALEGGSWVPISIDHLDFYQPLGTRVVSRGCLDRAKEVTDESVSFNVHILNEGGDALVRIEGLSLQKFSHRKSSGQSQFNEHLYEIDWSLAPLPHPFVMDNGKKHWLIFADRGGMGEQLSNRLRECGDDTCLVFAGNEFVCADNGIQIDPSQAEDYRALFQKCALDGGLNAIVHLWSLDMNIEDPAAAQIETSLQLSCESVLHMLQGFLAQAFSDVRVNFVTRGAMAVEDTDSVLPFQAPLWGMVSVMATEHPELQCCSIDLQSGKEGDIDGLFQEVTTPGDEHQVAYRNNKRLVARLMPCATANTDQQTEIDKESSYLITGGVGGLGLEVAKWLVDQGAGTIVLIGRTASPADLSDDLKAAASGRTKIVVVAADVAELQDLEAIIENINGSAQPLKGVIHAAGVLKKNLLSQMKWTSFRNVLVPKVHGAWNLHLLTRKADLDFFVCFSSIASFLGDPSLGSYAAANIFLDILCHQRRKQGVPAVALNWGPWKNVGMATSNSANVSNQKWLDKFGIETISPNEGIKTLGRLLNPPMAQVAVMPANWNTFLSRIFPGKEPFYKAMVSKSITKSEVEEVPFYQRVSGKTGNVLYNFVIHFFSDTISAILDQDKGEIPIDRPLIKLGIDSLMAFELTQKVQRETGLKLSLTDLMEGMTLNELATTLQIHLEEQRKSGVISCELSQDAEAPHVDDVVSIDHSDPAALLENIDDLSGKEVQELLARMLTPQLDKKDGKKV